MVAMSQLYLFDIGERIPRQRLSLPRRIVPREVREAMQKRYRYFDGFEPIIIEKHAPSFTPNRSSKKRRKAKKNKPRTGLKDPAWKMPAWYVDEKMPRRHRELQKLIYEVQAPMVRAGWKANHERKQNNYPTMPVLFGPVDTSEMG